MDCSLLQAPLDTEAEVQRRTCLSLVSQSQTERPPPTEMKWIIKWTSGRLGLRLETPASASAATKPERMGLFLHYNVASKPGSTHTYQSDRPINACVLPIGLDGIKRVRRGFPEELGLSMGDDNIQKIMAKVL